MEADYTKQCPLCGCESVENIFIKRSSFYPMGNDQYDEYCNYECEHCCSIWQYTAALFEVIEDNTDGIDPSTIASRCKSWVT